MNEIADLESRLSAAMDRISQGLTSLSSAETEGDADAAAQEISDLKAALEEERTANAQLQARIESLGTQLKQAQQEAQAEDITALKVAHEDEIASLRMQAAEERSAWEGLNARVVRMRRSNKMMQTNVTSLRNAALEKVVDPQIINQSLQLELDALQAALELERAEADVILKTLLPLVGDAADLDD